MTLTFLLLYLLICLIFKYTKISLQWFPHVWRQCDIPWIRTCPQMYFLPYFLTTFISKFISRFQSMEIMQSLSLLCWWNVSLFSFLVDGNQDVLGLRWRAQTVIYTLLWSGKIMSNVLKTTIQNKNNLLVCWNKFNCRKQNNMQFYYWRISLFSYYCNIWMKLSELPN